MKRSAFSDTLFRAGWLYMGGGLVMTWMLVWILLQGQVNAAAVLPPVSPPSLTYQWEQGVLRLQLVPASHEPVEISVHKPGGRIVYSRSWPYMPLMVEADLSWTAPGVYRLQVQTGSHRLTRIIRREP
ncbi:MAG: hypothetical protein SF053_12710 [Bacteroidia bacterium]|nr:hypothetical protein [Bacteroidia bacterium]